MSLVLNGTSGLTLPTPLAASQGGTGITTGLTGYTTLAGTETLTNKTITTSTLSAVTSVGTKYGRNDFSTWSNATLPLDYAAGPVIMVTAGINITSITMANWPTGSGGHLRLVATNFGAYTITFPTSWKWIKSDLSTTTTFSSLGVTLPAAGTCFIDLFSVDGGTTVYATIGRN